MHRGGIARIIEIQPGRRRRLHAAENPDHFTDVSRQGADIGVGLGTVPFHVVMLGCIPQVGITGGRVRFVEVVFHPGRGQTLIEDRAEGVQARETVGNLGMVAAVVVADTGQVLFQQVLQFQELLLRGPVPMVTPAQPGQLVAVVERRCKGFLQVLQEQLQVQHGLAAVDAQQFAVMADMLGMAGRAGQPDVVTVPGKADGQGVRIRRRLHPRQEAEAHHVQRVPQ